MDVRSAISRLRHLLQRGITSSLFSGMSSRFRSFQFPSLLIGSDPLFVGRAATEIMPASRVVSTPKLFADATSGDSKHQGIHIPRSPFSTVRRNPHTVRNNSPPFPSRQRSICSSWLDKIQLSNGWTPSSRTHQSKMVLRRIFKAMDSAVIAVRNATRMAGIASTQ